MQTAEKNSAADETESDYDLPEPLKGIAMKKYFTALLAVLVLMGGISSHLYAEEKTRAMPRVELLDDATMENLAELAEPTEAHGILYPLVGKWYYTVKYWSEESSEPQISTGILTSEMILAGRFLSSKTSLVLNIGGQTIPYEGWSILGYDTARNEFTSVWADTMMTGVMTGAGKYNEQLKTIEEEGRFTHPLLKEEQTYRSELQFIDDETYKRSIFLTGKFGREFKILGIEFSRM